MTEKKVLAVITARSGSKGLKNKNIREINGKPLIAYTIEAAIESEVFDTVMVSTDSIEYADIAKMYGAEVPMLRPPNLSGDDATSMDVLLYVIDWYKKNRKEFDNVCLLQPTSPLRTSQNIKNAYQLFIEKRAKSVVSVCECEHSPLWAGRLDEDLAMKDFANKILPNTQRQKLEKYYRLNGAIYLCEVEYLIKEKKFISKEAIAYIMDKQCSVDIDLIEDFNYAEFLMKASK